MRDSLNRFSLDAVKFNDQMFICLVAIWLVVIGTAISSIYSQPFSKKQRLFWILLVICLPVIGLLIYLPFSMPEGRQSALLSFIKKK
ncbi:MAG: PLDc N-terminal domain-containing protein [Limisphaerales bacterium]